MNTKPVRFIVIENNSKYDQWSKEPGMGQIVQTWKLTDAVQSGQEFAWFHLIAADAYGSGSAVQMNLKLSCLREISDSVADMLLPVRDPSKRLELLNDRCHLETFMQIERGTKVTVTYNSLTYPGVVYYQGKVPTIGTGTWFGVALPYHGGHGNCDGSLPNHDSPNLRYFKCAADSGVFVSCADLVLQVEPQFAQGNFDRGGFPENTSHRVGPLTTSTLPSFAASNFGTISLIEDVPFHIGDQVNWFRDGREKEKVTVKWIGRLFKEDKRPLYVGIEFERLTNSRTPGSEKDHPVFVPIQSLSLIEMQPDKTLLHLSNASDGQSNLRHMKHNTEEKGMFGKGKGIQGYKTSSGVDATLFSMFAFTKVFNGCLEKLEKDTDSLEQQLGKHTPTTCRNLLTVLRDSIIQSLHNNRYVPFGDVIKLGEAMAACYRGRIDGGYYWEFDVNNLKPEECLKLLFEESIQMNALLELTTGTFNWHTLLIEKNPMSIIPTLQHLFDQSFVASDARFLEVPKCFLLQIPSPDKHSGMYRYVYPNAVLDITEAVSGEPRQCSFCLEEQADIECKECFNWTTLPDTAKSTLGTMAFCYKCSETRHQHKPKHQPYEIKETSAAPYETPITMELLAVICNRNNRYVSFAKGNGTWYFMDSMAHVGEIGLYIPELRPCSELIEYLDPKHGLRMLKDSFEQQKNLPELISCFFQNTYFCMYQRVANK